MGGVTGGVARNKNDVEKDLDGYVRQTRLVCELKWPATSCLIYPSNPPIYMVDWMDRWRAATKNIRIPWNNEITTKMCTQWRLAFAEPAAMFSAFGYFFRSVSPRVFLLENDQWNRPRDLFQRSIGWSGEITMAAGLWRASRHIFSFGYFFRSISPSDVFLKIVRGTVLSR